jgi:membrane protein DedA with SNARE-associated domain
VLDSLVNLVSGSPITYVVVMVAVLVDAVFPLIPSETMIITAAVLASHGHLEIALIVPAAIVGAVAGDNISYAIGRTLGRRAEGGLFRGEKARRRLDWAEAAIEERVWLIAVGRFVPGGRTATTFACGALELPWRRFILWDAVGGTLWASYAAGLGYFGGSRFQHSLWKPLLVALGTGMLVAGGIELGRRLWNRRAARAKPPG